MNDKSISALELELDRLTEAFNEVYLLWLDILISTSEYFLAKAKFNANVRAVLDEIAARES